MTPPPLRTELHSGWTLRASAGPAPEAVLGAAIPAAVPGCVHTDLLAAGLIPDPYLDGNESLTSWIGLVDWTYRTAFTWEPGGHDRHDLVFDGLDTVAAVSLNGRVVLDAANQHRSYRVDVREALVEGRNELEVRFRSPVRYANEQSRALGARPRPYPMPYEAIRKSASNFGWDWGIATYTSGIWRPVRLESWSVARIAEVRLDAVPLPGGGRLEAEIVIERHDPDAALTARASLRGSEAAVEIPAGADTVRVAVEAPGVRRWWPVGYGDQPLYDAELTLDTPDGPLDAVERRIGFRTVRWDTEPDDEGTPFTLVVNDRPVFVKGANWIPDDALPVRIDRARYERRLRQALAANLNLIRVWGGGLYESEDFFELCDELGLLTWQDLLFACAAYPEEEPLRSEVEAEVREQIPRLASHPSLVLLCGNNENLWGYEDWGWKTILDGRTWGADYYYELFPRLVEELAPRTPYIPGSPYSPPGMHPNTEAHGSMHLWEQWNRRDWTTYAEHRPRFAAEFGWQGPPAWSTLVRAVSDEPLTPESPGMIAHQKAAEGNTKLTRGLVPHFRVPDDMENWHWAMQLNQAMAVRFALEHFRSWAPRTMGAVVWQLNDCWPVTSWSAIDGEERLKPLWHGVRSAFAPRLVTVQQRGERLAAVLCNDTGDDWDGDLVLRRTAFDGTPLAERIAPAFVAARCTLEVPIDPAVAAGGSPADEVLTASFGGERGLWFYTEPRDSRLEKPELTVRSEPVEGGTELLFTAANLVRDLTLLIDKADPDAVTEQGLVTLLPDESARFLVRHRGGLDLEALTAPGVVRSANELVAE
nr:hypothetical protein [Glycomyces albidus]